MAELIEAGLLMLWIVSGGEQLHRRLAYSDDRSNVGADHRRTHRLRYSPAAGQLLLHRKPCTSLLHC